MNAKLRRATIFFLLGIVGLIGCTNRKSNQDADMVTTSSDRVLKNDIGKEAAGQPILLQEITDASQPLASVIYHSIDAGTTWSPYANGIPPDATVSAFLIKDDKIFASTDKHGIYSVKEGETQWLRMDDNLPEDVDINAITALDDALIIGTFRHGILISKDGGKNWTYAAGQIRDTPIRGLLTKEKILFAGADNGIYKSFDYGKTWKQVYKGVQVNGFTVLNNNIYAALMNGAIMTTDGGASWKYIYKPHTLHDISNDGERLYAMTLGAGLLSSKNDGLTWEDVNYGLGTLNLYTFELKKFDQRIFAAQWYGIYASDNWGTDWQMIKSGLPDSTAFTTLETTRNGLIAGIGLRKK